MPSPAARLNHALRAPFPGGPLSHLLIAGQSNGVGSDATVLSPDPDARHARFRAGVRVGSSDLGPAVPLFEQADSINSAGGETLASAFAKALDKLSSRSTRFLFSSHAISSQNIAALKKGGSSGAFALGQGQVSEAKRVLTVPHPALGVLWVHGETDAQAANTNYYADLVQLQVDYDTDTKAITGQSDDVILYGSQCAAYPPGSTAATGATKTGSSQLMMLKAAIDNPTKIICVGPTYQLQWIADGLHYRAAYTRVLGGYFAKAVYRKLIGQSTLPLYMTAATRSGTTVTVTFNVPVSPLVWRLDLVQPPASGSTGAVLGFKYYDDSGAIPAVTDARITAANQVTLTLAGTPTGTAGSEEVRYGHSTSQTSGFGCGPLADSDPTLDAYGWPLPAFCCMCYVGVT